MPLGIQTVSFAPHWVQVTFFLQKAIRHLAFLQEPLPG